MSIPNSVLDLIVKAKEAGITLVYIPTQNQFMDRQGFNVQSWVLHTEESNEDSTNGWFENPVSQVSSNFAIDKAGRIFCFVPPEHAAWANGIVQEPNLSVSWINRFSNQQVNFNYLTLSIEHEGHYQDSHPAVQINSGVWLIRYLSPKMGIPINSDTIRQHKDITALDRPYCCGDDLFNKYRSILLSDFDCNPEGKVIGEGVKNLATQLREVVRTDERYFTWNETKTTGSITDTDNYKLLYDPENKDNNMVALHK